MTALCQLALGAFEAPVAELLSALAPLTRLTSLSLRASSNTVLIHQEPHASEVADALSPLTSLQSLQLWHLTGLEPAYVDAAVRALRHLTALAALDVSHTCKPEHAPALISGVAHLSGLAALAADDLGAGDRSAAALLDTPPRPGLLTSPDLCFWQLGQGSAEDAAICCDCLQRLTSLQVLSVSHNQFVGASARPLARCLRAMTQLRGLDVSWCKIDAAAMCALAPSLAQLRQLTALDVRSNPQSNMD